MRFCAYGVERCADFIDIGDVDMETIEDEILRLKEERNAVILAHVYQPDEIQEIADFTGDSFKLSVEASKTDADVIVFCGVRFMAETANILSPDKITLLPAEDAGCQMFDDTLLPRVKAELAAHPEYRLVSYVNTPASVKAISDVCCTSSNAVKVIESMPEDAEILFVPDPNLASYTAERTTRHIHVLEGGCPIHGNLRTDVLQRVKDEHPGALVLMHPECRPELRAMADYIGSTSGIVDYAAASDCKEFIIATEMGVFYQLEEACHRQGKTFYPASRSMLCVNMKKTNLTKVRDALRTLEPRVVVPEDVRKKAHAALSRMLEIK